MPENTPDAGAGGQPAGSNDLRPGDEAAPGTPGTGDAVCPKCEGKGRVGNEECVECGGTGIVVGAIGGA